MPTPSMRPEGFEVGWRIEITRDAYVKGLPSPMFDVGLRGLRAEIAVLTQ